MRLSALLAASLLLLAISVEAMAATEVRGVRLWRAPDNTRLVFDLSGPVQHNLFILTSPARIVVDIQGASLATGFDQLNLGNTPITGVRSAQRSPQEVRLVLDLSAAVTPKSFSLAPNQQYGNRLVIDLFDSDDSAAPVAIQEPIPVHQSVIQVAPPKPVLPALPDSGRRDVVIAIDAGHGGEDPGALGPKGVREKHVVLAISKELQRQLNAEKGFRAELVRTGDYFIPLRRRTEIARKKGADLFVSIHADAALRTSAFGASVYALSDRGATSETARMLANSENQSDLIGGAGNNVSLDDKDPMLAGVLLDMSMTGSMQASKDVGQKVLSNMGRVTSLHKKRVEQAGFMVLKSPDIPSILVETGFISNPGEAGKLATKSHQQALARSITSGVRQFFQQNPPPGTYLAAQRDAGKTPQGPREHVVTSGESLSMIAVRYRISLASLRGANHLRSDTVKVGQVLKIPATTLASTP